MNAYGPAYGPTDMKIDLVLSSFQFVTNELKA